MTVNNGNFEFQWNQIESGAPKEEPARQYYFMDEARKLLKAKFEEDLSSGRAMERYGEEALGEMITKKVFGTCAVVTFGCQMNAKDSEKLLGILESIGYRAVETEDADLVLYNTCTVRENANQRLYGRLGQAGARKKKNPRMLIGLCGCMMQESQAVEKIRGSYPFVDLVFGTHNIFLLAQLVCRCLLSQGAKKHRTLVDVWEGTDQIVEDLPADRKYPFKSVVNIMFGCNNFCSYCIVPYVRGRERSRKPQEILKEIRRLAEDGVVEVMLLGQNVNSYGKTLDEPMTFAQLLREVEKIDGIKRIRFMTSHPKDLSPELIQVMAESKKICRHFHLPLQSGSSRILEKMNRHYTKEQFLDLVRRLKEAVPGISLTTDIIVGFPGETEEDFLETMDVVRKAEFDSAFTFIYSKRTGTPAAVMENQVPEEIKRERMERLLALQNEISLEKNLSLVGKTLRVLAEGRSKTNADRFTGRTEGGKIVLFDGTDEMTGRFLPVRITRAAPFTLWGEVVE